MTDRTFYITTPIYYINGAPHIGHSYTTVAADAMARYHRLRGEQVHFLTGTDEHGQKVARAAEKAGKPAQAWADEISGQFRDLWPLLEITNDDFIRTTEPRHESRVQAAIRQMIASGDIYLGEYEGWYCVPDETFIPEKNLVEGKCPDCGRPVERLRESTYYFRMSKYVPWLIEYLEGHPDFVQPEIRRNEVLSRLRQGVNDLSVTRATLEWGIKAPVPENHTVYVWVDALFNYISALEWPGPVFDRYWPADYHFIGKEILWFHAAVWPCMLHCLGIEPPRRVFAHGWWVFGEDAKKMGKSTGNIVDPVPLVKHPKIGADALRYFLLRQTPFGADGQFTFDGFIARLNGDLANDLGNLVQRTTGMIGRYFEGKVPAADGPREALDAELVAIAAALPARVDEQMNGCQFSLALEAVWELVRTANQYVERNQPWVLAKKPEQRPRLGTVLYSLAEVCRLVSVWLEPFMPGKMAAVRERLGLPAALTGTLDSLAQWGQTVPGTAIRPGDPLFPRIDPKEIG